MTRGAASGGPLAGPLAVALACRPAVGGWPRDMSVDDVSGEPVAQVHRSGRAPLPAPGAERWFAALGARFEILKPSILGVRFALEAEASAGGAPPPRDIGPAARALERAVVPHVLRAVGLEAFAAGVRLAIHARLDGRAERGAKLEVGAPGAVRGAFAPEDGVVADFLAGLGPWLDGVAFVALALDARSGSAHGRLVLRRAVLRLDAETRREGRRPPGGGASAGARGT